MFIIIYKKSTKHVVHVRSDNSTTQALAENLFNIYLEDSKANTDQVADLAYIETTPVQLVFDAEKYLWNESTQQVDLNPDYVTPTSQQETTA